MKKIIVAIIFGIKVGAILSLAVALTIYLSVAPIIYFVDIVYESVSFLDFFRNWSSSDLFLMWWDIFKDYKTAIYILKIFFLFFLICAVIKFISKNNCD